MHNDKEELMKELIKKRANDELEQEAQELIKGGIEFKPYFKDEMLMAQIDSTTDEDIDTFRNTLGLVSALWNEIMKEHVKNSVERKKRLMRLEKEHLVDMVFNLESKNEILVNNLLEVEKMYNDLKGEQ